MILRLVLVALLAAPSAAADEIRCAVASNFAGCLGEIAREQAVQAGKPENIVEKMVEGRLRKFYEDVCLLEQVYVIDGESKVADVIAQAGKDAGAEISMFIEADEQQIEASAKLGAEMVELHTGAFANATGAEAEAELAKLVAGAKAAHSAGIQVNAGHGITLEHTEEMLTVPHLDTLNIGHSIVSRAVFVGLHEAVREMLVKLGNS